MATTDSPRSVAESIIERPHNTTVNAFVICLKRKPVSDSALQSWKQVFPNTSVYEAVDGRNIDIENDNRIHALARMHMSPNNTVAHDSVFAIPTRGAIGCFLSHYNLLQWSVQHNKPIVVIEQDAVFSKHAQKVLPELFNQIPQDAEYVSLLYILQNHTSPYNTHFRRLHGPQCDGNQCYYMTPQGARKVLKHCLPIVTQFDLLIGTVAHTDPTFKGYVLSTRLYSLWKVFEDNLGSSIQNFAVKKYLPRSNMFYYSVLFLIVVLVVYTVYTIVKKFIRQPKLSST